MAVPESVYVSVFCVCVRGVFVVLFEVLFEVLLDVLLEVFVHVFLSLARPLSLSLALPRTPSLSLPPARPPLSLLLPRYLVTTLQGRDVWGKKKVVRQVQEEVASPYWRDVTFDNMQALPKTKTKTGSAADTSGRGVSFLEGRDV